MLLRDIFDEVRKDFSLEPPHIVMKVDIECGYTFRLQGYEYFTSLPHCSILTCVKFEFELLVLLLLKKAYEQS